MSFEIIGVIGIAVLLVLLASGENKADLPGDRTWGQAIARAGNVCLAAIFLDPRERPISYEERKAWHEEWQPPSEEMLDFAFAPEQVFGTGRPFYAMDVALPLETFMENAAGLGSATVPPMSDAPRARGVRGRMGVGRDKRALTEVRSAGGRPGISRRSGRASSVCSGRLRPVDGPPPSGGRSRRPARATANGRV